MELTKITQTLLDKNASHGELLRVVHELSAFFEQYSFISTKMSRYELSKDAIHTYLDSGIAISPLDAAICTHEYLRTAKYIRAVFEALNDLLMKFQDQEINLLYAGCGPYGTLVIPLLSFFDSKRLKVTFLDIHRSSLNSIQNIIQALGLEDFVKGYIQEDATLYQSPQDLHIIVTETMKAAFDNEPQVAITLNLLPQLLKGGVFLPQRVVVGFELAITKHQQENGYIKKTKQSKPLCTVIDFDTTKELKKENVIATKIFQVSKKVNQKMAPFFTTTIYIYKEHVLKENESSLNIPKKIKFSKTLSKNDRVSFVYDFGAKPTIGYSLNASPDIYQNKASYV